LSAAFTVVEGVGPLLEAELVMQPITRSNMPFWGRAVFENGGDANLDLPLLRIQAPPGGEVWAANADRAGATGSLQFLAIAQDQYNGGVLAPGQRGVFNFRGVIPAAGDTNFSLSVITKENSDPFDAEALRDQIRPNPTPELWDDAFDVVAAQLGTTYGSFAAALAEAADEARGHSLTIQSARQLLDYMIERAIIFDLPADVRGQLFLNTDGVITPLPRAIVSGIASFDLDNLEERVSGGRAWYDGSFALRDLPLGELEIVVTGYLSPDPATLFYSGAAQTGVEITALPGGEIRGIVREEGLWWGYIRAAGVTARDAGGHLLATAETDQWGRYALRGLPLHQPIYLTVDSDDFLPPTAESITLTNHNPATRNINMVAGGSISGIVYDPNGQPVEGALVLANPVEADFGRQTFSGPGGFYRFNGLGDGRYLITAATELHAPGSANNVTVVEGTLVANVDLHMQTAGALNLTITDADSGLPLPGAVAAPVVVGLFNVQATAQGGGLAALNGLPGGQIAIQLTANGYHTTIVTATIAPGNTASISAAMSARGSMAGTVQRSGGAPLANIPVMISGDHLAQPLTLFTDSNGQFALTNVPDGNYIATLGEDLIAGRQDITIANGANVAMNWSLDVALVSGRMLAADGVTPITDAIVHLLRDGQEIETTVVDDLGRYQFYLLEAGLFSLMAVADNAAALLADVAITPGNDLLNADLVANGGSLTAVVTQNGSPVADASVAIARTEFPNELGWNMLTATNGEAIFTNLPAGEYLIILNRPGFVEMEMVVMHTASAQTVNVSLAPGQTVNGQVETAFGETVSSGRVIFIHETTQQPFIATIRANGAYSIDYLADGVYTVWVAGRDFQAQKLTGVDLTAPGPHTLDLAVPEMGAALAGYVTDADGAPIAGALLALYREGQLLQQTRSDLRGFYRFTQVLEGAQTLVANASGFTPVETPVMMPLTGQASVNINLGSPQAFTLPIADNELLRRAAESGGPGQWVDSWLTGVDRPQKDPYHQALEAHNLQLPPVELQTPEVVRAFQDFQRNSNLLSKRYHELSDAHFEAWEQGIVNVGLIASETTLFAAKTYAGGRIKAMGADGKKFEAALNLVDNLSGIIGDVQTGNFTGALQKATTMKQGSEGFGETRLGKTAEALGTAQEVLSILGDIQTAYNDRLGGIERYAFRETIYQLQLELTRQKHQEYLAILRAERDSQQNPEEQEPPDPQDEEPVDEEEITRNDSWDPNDVIGPAGYGPERWIRRDFTTLPYMIRFENEADAAAPAREVFITHTLDESLDWTTFAFGDVGFGEYTLDVPPGRQTFFTRFDLQSELGIYVDVTGDFDLTTGTASWYFAAIDPATFDLLADPIGGFLPPNFSSPEGEGFVNFTVRARNTAVTGATIIAQANIIFDANEPIETPEYVNTLDAEPPASAVNPLPTESPVNFTVSWSGSDGAGSGVAHYDVYVAVDGGPFVRWLQRTTATSATFNGETGRSYAFYSVATDNVGWRQPTPTAAQASTTIPGDAEPPEMEHTLFLPLVIRP
jgi:hypothetical protein